MREPGGGEAEGPGARVPGAGVPGAEVAGAEGVETSITLSPLVFIFD